MEESETSEPWTERKGQGRWLSVPAEKCVAMMIDDFNALYTFPFAATSNTQSYLPSITLQITSPTNQTLNIVLGFSHI